MLKKILFPLLLGKAEKLAVEFDAAARNLEKTQRDVLISKLRRNEESAFGRKFRFKEIKDIPSFRNNLPIADYSFYSPYIERVKEGEVSALFGTGTKIIMFALTSGTTKEPKYIPVTGSFFDDYRRGWLIWGYYVHKKYPGIIEKMMLPVTSAFDEFRTAKGVPCGAISGLSSEKQNFVTRSIYAVPSAIYKIKDAESKYYLMMRIALEKEIGSLTTANPSTILSLVRIARRDGEELIRDIFGGKISGRLKIPEDLRGVLEKRLRPNRRRAAQLERFLSDRGSLLPSDYWPGLEVITNWKGGTLSTYLDSYPEYFGATPVRDIGLIASEGRMTIPMDDEGSSGALDITSHFYEFIPEEDEDKSSPQILLAGEVKAGKRYFIILTTSSGLYRYNIHDLVEVTGFYNQAPVVRFLNKGRHISSITGEKLTEYQAVLAVKAAAKACSLNMDTFTLVPCREENPHYSLMVENEVIGDKTGWERFACALDRGLREANMEYDCKRRSNRLFPPGLLIVRDGSFEALKKEHIERQRGRAEQYKHIFLSPDGDFYKRFDIIGRFFALSRV